MGRAAVGGHGHRRHAAQGGTDVDRRARHRRGPAARGQRRRPTRRRRARGVLGAAPGYARPGACGGARPAGRLGDPTALSGRAAGTGAWLLALAPGRIPLPAAVPGGHRCRADGRRSLAACRRGQPCGGQHARCRHGAGRACCAGALRPIVPRHAAGSAAQRRRQRQAGRDQRAIAQVAGAGRRVGHALPRWRRSAAVAAGALPLPRPKPMASR